MRLVPLRNTDDIKGAVALLREENISNVITGAPARRSPYFNLVERQESGVVRLAKTPDTPIIRRQDAPTCFDMNASIYVWKWESLMQHDTLFLEDTKLFEMPEERSLDLDSELDFQMIEFLAQKGS